MNSIQSCLTLCTPMDYTACQVTSVVSDSVQPHGLQPTRLLRPWDSPGKNTGVGCHFLLQGLYSLWNSPGQNTGVGSLSLLPGIFSTQRSNPGLPHCGQILYQLSHKGSPRILEGSLSLRQQIFPTQELNWGLLYCRQILYQLSYQGSPLEYS